MDIIIKFVKEFSASTTFERIEVHYDVGEHAKLMQVVTVCRKRNSLIWVLWKAETFQKDGSIETLGKIDRNLNPSDFVLTVYNGFLLHKS